MTCDGKGAPVLGCPCSFCRGWATSEALTRLQAQAYAEEAERLSRPTGDFLEQEDRRG